MLDAEEYEELVEHWEQVLSRGGLGERIYKKQIRGRRGTPARAAAVQREVVVDPSATWVWDQALPDAVRAPETALQAFMEAEPHNDPAQDKETSQALREGLLDGMELILEPEMVDLLCRRYFGQASIAELADEKGIALSTMSERIGRALEALQATLPQCSDIIQDYLENES